jgi:hypothetical protein
MTHYDSDNGQDVLWIQVLWNTSPRARIPHVCARCKDPIEPGQTYSSMGWEEDGEFRYEKTHLHAHQYPSECPSLRERDLAEIAASDVDPSNPFASANIKCEVPY